MGFGVLRYGDIGAQEVSRRFGGKVADTTALAAVKSTSCFDGMFAIVGAGSLYVYDGASSASASANVVVVPADTPTTGRWVRPTITG